MLALILATASPAQQTLPTVTSQPARTSPEWLKSGVIYQVFVRSFSASALMFTLDGVPLIYNGMEVGDSTQSSDPALFEPQKIFWGSAKRG